jgi:hypothetical protein
MGEADLKLISSDERRAGLECAGSRGGHAAAR